MQVANLKNKFVQEKDDFVSSTQLLSKLEAKLNILKNQTIHFLDIAKSKTGRDHPQLLIAVNEKRMDSIISLLSVFSRFQKIVNVQYSDDALLKQARTNIRCFVLWNHIFYKHILNYENNPRDLKVRACATNNKSCFSIFANFNSHSHKDIFEHRLDKWNLCITSSLEKFELRMREHLMKDYQ